MPSIDIALELSLAKDAAEEIILSVDFRVLNAGCPAHMGDLNYPGHPAESIEVEIEAVFWPTKEWVSGGKFTPGHTKLPLTAIPDTIHDALIDYICEHHHDELKDHAA